MRCLSPLTVTPYKDSKKAILVPCGKCDFCKAKRRSDLAFRLDAEYYAPDTLFAFMVTLTYDQKHLPVFVDEKTGMEIECFSRSDIQKYHKRLRKRLDGLSSFKYFTCAEHGDKFGRPHYHEILFVKSYNNQLGDSLEFYRDAVDKSWNLGINRVERPRGFSALSYVTKYVTKDAGYYVNEDFKLAKPFILQSSGLGIHIIADKFFPYDSDLRFLDSQGVQHYLPRYYLSKIYTDKFTQMRRKAFIDAKIFWIDKLIQDSTGVLTESRLAKQYNIKSYYSRCLNTLRGISSNSNIFIRSYEY